MKAKEIRELGVEEIQQRLREEKELLQQFRFQHAVATLPSPILVRHKRREIARLQTILREKTAARQA